MIFSKVLSAIVGSILTVIALPCNGVTQNHEKNKSLYEKNYVFEKTWTLYITAEKPARQVYQCEFQQAARQEDIYPKYREVHERDEL